MVVALCCEGGEKMKHNELEEKVFDTLLEESCRQWCAFMEDEPERQTGEGFSGFFRQIYAEKYAEYQQSISAQSAAKENTPQQNMGM